MRYDGIGNVRRMTQNDIMSPAGGSPYAVTDTTRDALYQYNGTPHAASQVGGKFHWYDANGNQAYSTDYFWWWRSMSWDEENRLTSVNEAGTTTSFRYDAGGQRVAKLGSSTMLYPSAYVTVNNGSTVTKHVFAGGERVSSIVRTAGDGSAGERQYWLHSDSGGASQYVTGAGGWVTTHNETLPFGEPWITQDWSWDQVARSFRGSERDGETRLHHMGERYYDASEARWTSADPALSAFMDGGEVYDPRNLAAYSYSFNSPVSYWDPTGLRPQARRSPSTFTTRNPDGEVEIREGCNRNGTNCSSITYRPPHQQPGQTQSAAPQSTAAQQSSSSSTSTPVGIVGRRREEMPGGGSVETALYYPAGGGPNDVQFATHMVTPEADRPRTNVVQFIHHNLVFFTNRGRQIRPPRAVRERSLHNPYPLPLQDNRSDEHLDVWFRRPVTRTSSYYLGPNSRAESSAYHGSGITFADSPMIPPDAVAAVAQQLQSSLRRGEHFVSARSNNIYTLVATHDGHPRIANSRRVTQHFYRDPSTGNWQWGDRSISTQPSVVLRRWTSGMERARREFRNTMLPWVIRNQHLVEK